MHSDPIASGSVSQSHAPFWAPLEAALGTNIAGWFMWMYEIRLDDGTRIDAYKHVATRRYLHLSDDGRAFAYGADETFREVGLALAIVQAFTGWERSSPPPRHVRELRAAVASARGLAPRLVAAFPPR